MFKRQLLKLSLLIGSAFISVPCFSQQWSPNKSIKLIVPYAAGGPADTLARVLASKMSPSLGQSVVVENRAGAGGVIGVDAAIKAPADGYTLSVTAQGPLAGMPNLSKTPYGLSDMQFITMIAKIPSVLAVSSKVDINSAAAFIQRAKSQPGKLNYGSSGAGTTQHIGMELLKDASNTYITHIPYRGAAPVIAALLAGDIDVTMVDVLPILPHVNSGAARVLAVAAAQRLPQLPQIPTTIELGLGSVQMETVYGVVAPKGLPTNIANRLRESILAAVNSLEVRELLVRQGATAATGSGEAYQTAMQIESEKYKRIITKAKIFLE
jgi:tripartite-type tricarboxylate transporter receptor subunit TctC